MAIKVPQEGKFLTSKQLDALMRAGTKGTVTKLSAYAKKALQLSTEKNLYQQKLVNTKNSAYQRSRHLYGSITSTRTDDSGDSFFSVAGFEDEYLRARSTPPEFKKTRRGKKRLVKFGRYTDIYGDYVGDQMIEDGWLEDGTDRPSMVPRRGAEMIESATEMVEDFIGGFGIEAEIKKEFGTLVVERFR